MLTKVRRIEAMKGGDLQPLKFKNLRHPIAVRPGTNDLATLLDTVVRQEYGHYLPVGDILTMIDAGAFIGDTSAWYLSRYPNLKIWALEPNLLNHSLAERNLAPYGDRAAVLPLALAARQGSIPFAGDGTGGKIGIEGLEVTTTTVPHLLSRIPTGRVDVLKIDIEGAELDVFTNGAEAWLDRVGLIVVELHGPEIERAVLNVLDRSFFEARQYRSVWYCKKTA